MAEETQNSVEEQTGMPGVPAEKEVSSFRMIFTLALAGFLSGWVLVLAYVYTKPLIDANKAAAIERAIYKVLPGSVSYQTLELKDGKVVEHDPSAEQSSAKGEEPKLLYAGFDESGAMTGFALLGAEPGFQDIIGGLTGYDPLAKKIIGFEVLESKETPGLGDKIFKDMAFQENFKALEVLPEILFAKKGEKTKANEVESITGATISSKAVIRLLNNSMNEWVAPIDEYMKTIQATPETENNE